MKKASTYYRKIIVVRKPRKRSKIEENLERAAGKRWLFPCIKEKTLRAESLFLLLKETKNGNENVIPALSFVLFLILIEQRLKLLESSFLVVVHIR